MNIFFFNYFLHQSPNILIHHQIFNPSIGLGEIISATVLAITAVILYLQVREIKKSTKYLEYQTKPVAYFLIRASKNLGYSDGKNILFVKNESKFKILFYIRITLQSGSKTIILEEFWNKNNPLHLYPGQGFMRFPNVVQLDKFLEEEQKQIIANIEYKMASSYAPSEVYTDYHKEKWIYNGRFWTGPNGLSEDGMIELLPITEIRQEENKK